MQKQLFYCRQQRGASALFHYEPYREMFNLVGVAQGTNLDEYIDCYTKLKEMGFEYVAVGGLLRRRNNTVRTAYVRDEAFMFGILHELRHRYPDDWLFALGTFHPSRMDGLKELGVWADYKGWIFQYEKRNDTLNSLLATLATNHLEHMLHTQRVGISTQLAVLQRLVARREATVRKREKLSQQLFIGRRNLRAAFLTLYTELSARGSLLAPRLRTLSTHALPDDTEEKHVVDALRSLDRGSEDVELMLRNIQKNREIRAQIKALDSKLDRFNMQIQREITTLLDGTAELPTELRDYCCQLINVIDLSERDYRFQQVRDKVVEKIFSSLL